MLQFKIDQGKCTLCGLCARDCPVNIIDMDAGWPRIAAENEPACLGCQVCPTAALSPLGRKPEDSLPLAGAFPEPDRLATLIKGRQIVTPELQCLGKAFHFLNGIIHHLDHFMLPQRIELLILLQNPFQIRQPVK
jgi:hypothetical protein